MDHRQKPFDYQVNPLLEERKEAESKLVPIQTTEEWILWIKRKKFTLSLHIFNAEIDMVDEESSVDGLKEVYCVVYLGGEREASKQKTLMANPEEATWNHSFIFHDLSWESQIVIELKTQRRIGENVLLASYSFTIWDLLKKSDHERQSFRIGLCSEMYQVSLLTQMDLDPPISWVDRRRSLEHLDQAYFTASETGCCCLIDFDVKADQIDLAPLQAPKISRQLMMKRVSNVMEARLGNIK